MGNSIHSDGADFMINAHVQQTKQRFPMWGADTGSNLRPYARSLAVLGRDAVDHQLR